MPDEDTQWREALREARRQAQDPSPEQRAFDLLWLEWFNTHMDRSRTPNRAIPYAWLITEALHGRRPGAAAH